jgi:hypothetical protein
MLPHFACTCKWGYYTQKTSNSKPLWMPSCQYTCPFTSSVTLAHAFSIPTMDDLLHLVAFGEIVPMPRCLICLWTCIPLSSKADNDGSTYNQHPNKHNSIWLHHPFLLQLSAEFQCISIVAYSSQAASREYIMCVDILLNTTSCTSLMKLPHSAYMSRRSHTYVVACTKPLCMIWVCTNY